MKAFAHLFVLLASFALPAVAAESVDEIVTKANQAAYYSGKDGRATVKMVIEDAKGGKRDRAFKILRLNGEGGNQKFYVYFEEPADVRKMAFLVWKNATGEDDRWLWLPALNLVKRIAPGDKRTSFVGSDFVYEDVSGRRLSDDSHELVKEENGQYLLKNVPKSTTGVDFAYYLMWIDKGSYLPRKAEYYDAQGKLFRTVEALKVETIEGLPTVTVSRVKDLRTGSTTNLTFSDIHYNLGLEDRIFTERFLRRPPKEVAAN